MEIPQRKKLPHQVPLWIDPQKETYFITVNCQARGPNQLAQAEIGVPLLDSVRFRNERFVWFAHVFLVMPDHIHALLSFPPSPTHLAGDRDLVEALDGTATGHCVAAGFL